MSTPFSKIVHARHIAPAPHRDGGDGQEAHSSKRGMVVAACLQCQKKKCKCDGARPTCQPCRTRQLQCEFGVPEGISQKDRIKQKYPALEKRAGDLDRLINELTYGMEEVAINLLLRLRSGESVQSILQSIPPPINTGTSSESMGSPSNPSNQASFGTPNSLTASYCQSELPMELRVSGGLPNIPFGSPENVTEWNDHEDLL